MPYPTLSYFDLKDRIAASKDPHSDRYIRWNNPSSSLLFLKLTGILNVNEQVFIKKDLEKDCPENDNPAPSC